MVPELMQRELPPQQLGAELLRPRARPRRRRARASAGEISPKCRCGDRPEVASRSGRSRAVAYASRCRPRNRASRARAPASPGRPVGAQLRRVGAEPPVRQHLGGRRGGQGGNPRRRRMRRPQAGGGRGGGAGERRIDPVAAAAAAAQRVGRDQGHGAEAAEADALRGQRGGHRALLLRGPRARARPRHGPRSPRSPAPGRAGSAPPPPGAAPAPRRRHPARRRARPGCGAATSAPRRPAPRGRRRPHPGRTPAAPAGRRPAPRATPRGRQGGGRCGTTEERAGRQGPSEKHAPCGRGRKGHDTRRNRRALAPPPDSRA